MERRSTSTAASIATEAKLRSPSPTATSSPNAYDASGNLLTITDFDNNVTTPTYSSGKVSTLAEPAYTTSLGYNGSGQLTSITDPAPGAPATTPVTTFGYASTTVDRITRLQDPDSNTTTFSYSS